LFEKNVLELYREKHFRIFGKKRVPKFFTKFISVFMRKSSRNLFWKVFEKENCWNVSRNLFKNVSRKKFSKCVSENFREKTLETFTEKSYGVFSKKNSRIFWAKRRAEVFLEIYFRMFLQKKFEFYFRMLVRLELYIFLLFYYVFCGPIIAF
jgi:hypothetical protein